MVGSLSRGPFRGHLTEIYKAPASTVILNIFDMPIAIKANQYFDQLDQLLSHQQEKLFMMAFELYDFGADKKIDAVDLFALCKHNGDLDSEELFRDAYSKDICSIAIAIGKKRKALGMEEMDIGLKLEAIERKL